MSRKLQTAQTNFTVGEVDPLIKARIDNKYYYNGAEKMRNVVVFPQGGSRRRPGLGYIDVIRPVVTMIASGSITATAPNGGTAANALDDDVTTVVTTTSDLSTTNPYVILHYDLGAATEVIYADIALFSISAGTDTTGFVVQYSNDDASWSNYAVGGYAIPASTTPVTRRFSSNLPKTITARYWRFVRINSADLSTAKVTVGDFLLWAPTATLSDMRLIDFTFSNTQAYLFSVTDQNIAVYRNDVWQSDIRFLLTTDELNTMNWTQSLDTLISVHEDLAPIKILREGAHNQWQPQFVTFDRKPTHDFGTVSTTGDGTPSATSGSGVTFTSTASSFVASDVGKYIRGNGGFALITAQGGTTATITIIEPYRFTNTNPIGAGDWSIEEDAWSDARGWPRSATFHGGRLWFGGSKTLLQTLWGSKSAQFFDFGSGSGLDDEAIDVTLDTDQVSEIHQIYSGRNLSIFTGAAEFYVPDNLVDPITPSNVRVVRSTSRGIKEGLRVVEVSGAILFIQRFGKALREYLYNDIEQNYSSNNLSLLSSHLIVDPVDMALRKSTSTDEADFVPIVNSDGTLCLLTTLREQNVTAFTLQLTNGLFLRTASVDTEIYFGVERTVNGEQVRYIEKFDNDLLLDCSVTADRPSKDQYTAIAGQTVFAFTQSIMSTDELRVIRYDSVVDEWTQLYAGTDYTASALPGTGSITLMTSCSSGDRVIISYPTSSFSGASHLEGEEVRIVGDDAVKNLTTVSSGSAVLDDEQWEVSAELGLDFPDVTGRGLNEGVWIKDLPVEPQLPEGATAGRKRRVVSVIAKVFETTHFAVNGKTVPFNDLTDDATALEDTVEEFTGDKIIKGMLGWDDYGQVEITQTIPAKLTLLSITKRVAI